MADEKDELLDELDEEVTANSAATPESRDAHLEEKVVDLPPLMTAAELLEEEEDPLAAIPQEPADAETPPDEAIPPFIIERNKYGPGSHSIRLASGMPVGRWLEAEHNDLDGAQVAELLAGMGMETELALWFGKVRDGRIEANASVAANPAIKRGAADEKVRIAQKKAVQEAFVKAQREKAKK